MYNYKNAEFSVRKINYVLEKCYSHVLKVDKKLIHKSKPPSIVTHSTPQYKGVDTAVCQEPSGYLAYKHDILNWLIPKEDFP
jgi:hypothetical protein